MTTYLFVDTETTGFPESWKAQWSDTDNWPRIVQIAWELCTDTYEVIDSCECLVKPEGFVIPEDATAVHGITTEVALRDGLPICWALESFIAALHRTHCLVAHNVRYDLAVIAAEMIRNGYSTDILSSKRALCTMQLSSKYCGLKQNGSNRMKYPNMTELYEKCFGERKGRAHTAGDDVRACAECFFELKKQGVIRG